MSSNRLSIGHFNSPQRKWTFSPESCCLFSTNINNLIECCLSLHTLVTFPEDHHHPTLELNYSLYRDSVIKNKQNNFKMHRFNNAKFDLLNCLVKSTIWFDIKNISPESRTAMDFLKNSVREKIIVSADVAQNTIYSTKKLF